MIRFARYSVDEVFEAMGNKGVLSDGVKFRPSSQRMVLFKVKGTECVTCHINGNVFVLESHHEDVKPHLNLYAESNGQLTLMTKDHIFPKSKGGANELENYQTMCTICNGQKSDKVE